MEIKSVVVLNKSDKPNSNNRIYPESLIIKKQFGDDEFIPVLFEFDEDKELGQCKNFKIEGNQLLCDMIIHDEQIVRDILGEFTPVIACCVGDNHTEFIKEINAIKINEMEILSIGLVEDPADETLKKLKEYI